MLNWDQYRNELMGRLGELGESSPDTMKGYGLIANAGEKTQALDAKTRELIAIAVAVTTRCDGCIAIHAKEALAQGATKQEIVDALGVAISLNAGAALVYSARALDAVASCDKAAQ